MIYDTDFQIVGVESVSDGAGGFTETTELGDSFSFHKAPVKVETMLREYGLTSNKAFKLITKEKINADELSILQEVSTEDNYKIIDSLNYSQSVYTILLVEKVR